MNEILITYFFIGCLFCSYDFDKGGSDFFRDKIAKVIEYYMLPSFLKPLFLIYSIIYNILFWPYLILNRPSYRTK